MPLRYHIIIRRQLYLWHILHTEESELIVRVFNSQKLTPKRGDWIKMVEDDHAKLGLTLSYPMKAKTSQNMFKQLVKEKALALLELNLQVTSGKLF